MNDELLVTRYVQGDADAFNILVSRYENRLYGMALRMLGNHEDALDAVQEILVRLMRSLPNFRGDAKFSTWLFRLTANTCVDYRRKLYRRSNPLTEELNLQMEAPDQDPDHRCASRFREQLIDEAIRKLPEAQRTLLVLRDREGLSNQEVADILAIDVGTLKSRLHRARGALRRLLEAGVVVKGYEQLGPQNLAATYDMT